MTNSEQSLADSEKNSSSFDALQPAPAHVASQFGSSSSSHRWQRTIRRQWLIFVNSTTYKLLNKKLNDWKIILIQISIACCRISCRLSPTMRLPWLISITGTKIGNVKSGRLLAGVSWICDVRNWAFFKMNSSTLMQMIRGDPFRWDGTSPFCSGKCSGWDITNHYHHLKSVETIQNDIFRYLFHKTTQKNVKVVLMFHLWRDELEVREHTAGDGKQCWTGAAFFLDWTTLTFFRSSVFCPVSTCDDTILHF